MLYVACAEGRRHPRPGPPSAHPSCTSQSAIPCTLSHVCSVLVHGPRESDLTRLKPPLSYIIDHLVSLRNWQSRDRSLGTKKQTQMTGMCGMIYGAIGGSPPDSSFPKVVFVVLYRVLKGLLAYRDHTTSPCRTYVRERGE